MHRFKPQSLTFKQSLLIGLSALSLVACGGGGSSASEAPEPNKKEKTTIKKEKKETTTKKGKNNTTTVTIAAPTKVQFKITVDKSRAEQYSLVWQKPKDVAEFVVYTAQSDLTGKTAQQLEALTSDSNPQKQTTKINLVAGKTSHIFKNLNKGDTRYAVVMSVVNGNTSTPALPTDTLFVTKGEHFYTMRDNQDKCVVDIKNNLIWELKQASGLHGKDHVYTWYDSTQAAGKQGKASPANASTCATKGRCDTEKFVTDVNQETWCGFSDWRMPTGKGDKKFNELKSLVDTNRPSGKPKINVLFENTLANIYWSSSPNANDNNFAWGVDFYGGLDGSRYKQNLNRVRLVRAR